jgi:hypothetical protein
MLPIMCMCHEPTPAHLQVAALLRWGVRVHELEGMHDVIIVWPDGAAALYFLGAQACAASVTAMPGELELAVHWHRRLGHLGYDTLAKLLRAGMLEGFSMTPASFVRARKVAASCSHGPVRARPWVPFQLHD